MSLADVREQLAEAASSVDGIDCAPYYRQTTTAGSASVRLARVARDDSGLGFIATWQVVVMLPAALADSERFAEQRLPDLIDAIAEIAVVTSVQFVQMVLEAGTAVPVLILEAARESEI